jgi:MinD-like ATPase involved in chromosome partitioning or flagellar assembly
MMPEMDGYEVAKRLRADSATAGIPIIMFTAKSQVEDKLQGFEAGADDYLTKPTQPRELFAHMRAVLARSSKTSKAPAPPRDRGCMIGILAARGGLGVSTLALNLGIALAKRRQKEVLVADFRPGQGTVGLELGYRKTEGLNRLMQRKPTELTAGEIDYELVTHASGVRLLLSSYQPRDARYSAQIASFEALARHLPALADYVLLDLGTSLGPVNEKVITYCDEVILVVEPFSHSIIQTRALLDDLVAGGVGDSRIQVVLVNRSRSGLQLSLDQAREQLGRDISIVITPAPELAFQAATHAVPIVIREPESLTAQQFNKLVEKVSVRR